LLKKIENWSLTSLQQRFVKDRRTPVKHARYYRLLLTEGHLTRQCFGSMVITHGSLGASIVRFQPSSKHIATWQKTGQ